MSKATKRKHVTKEVMDEFVLPEGDKQIVKVISSRGNNLHEVQDADRKTFLVSMPTKFRKNVWIKRGDFVMVEPIEEGDKVKAEITHILYKEQIKFIKEEKLWPVEFDSPLKNQANNEAMIPDDMLPPSDDEDEDDEEGSDGFQQIISNPNRRVLINTGSDGSEVDED